MENWLLFSLIALISTTIHLTLMASITKNINNIGDIITIILLVTSLTGLISVAILAYRYYKNKNLFLIRNKCKASLIPIMAIFIIFIQIGLIIGASVSPARSLLIVNTNVILVAIISFLFLNEMLSFKTIIGFILGLTGIGLVIHDKI